MEEQVKNPLGYEKIGKLMLIYSIPSIISLLVNSLYNIVDQIFIGQSMGYLGNAATIVIMPLTMISMALFVMLGNGGAAFMSLNLGRGNKEEASKGTGNAIIASLLFGILLCAIFLLFMEPICRLFGATDTVLPYAIEYGRIIAIGIPFTSFSGSINSLIRADGSPKFSMASMLVGAIINVILDPIFIFVFDWGIAGAAWATIIGQIIGAIVSFLYLWKFKSVDFNISYLKIEGRILSKVSGLGVSSFVTQASTVVVAIVANQLLTKYGVQSAYGAEIPLAAHGITMKADQIVLSICLGLATGCQPIIGFNYGAKQYDRVKKTILNCIAISSIVMIIATIVFQLFPMSIVRIFGSETALYNEFAVKSFRIYLMLVILTGFHICTGIYFQAIGKPIQATIISLSRQLLIRVPALIICAVMIGVEGVLWSGPISDALAFLIAVIFIIRDLRILKNLDMSNMVLSPK